MRRSRSAANTRYHDRDRRTSTRSSSRYDDESDNSTFFYFDSDSDSDGLSSYRGSSRKHTGIDDWMYGSHSDDSYPDTRRGARKESYRDRSRSKRSHLVIDSESDDSSFYEIEHRGPRRNRSNHSLRTAMIRNGDRTFSESECGSDSDSNGPHNFSSRIERIKSRSRQSFSSDDDSRSGSRSSRRRNRKPPEGMRRARSDPNLVQSVQRPGDQQPQLTNPVVVSAQNQQMGIQTGNDPGLLRSSSFKSTGNFGQNFLPNQQNSMSRLMMNANFSNQGNGNPIAGDGLRRNLSSNNIMGNTNPRMPLGPGNMVRSTSGQSFHTFASGQDQFTRSGHGALAHMNHQARPHMTKWKSQNSLGNNDAMLGNAMSPMGSGLVHGASLRSFANRDAMLDNPMQQQASRLMRNSLNQNTCNNDVLSRSMHSDRSGMVRVTSPSSLGNNNPLLNHNSMHSHRQGLMGDTQSSQRSIRSKNGFLHGLIHCDPKTAIDGCQQSCRTSNTQWEAETNNSDSVFGDSISVLSGASGDGSATSPVSVPSQSLADQIFSRQMYSRSRRGDTYSVVSNGDPPGMDMNRSRKYRNNGFSDEHSQCTFDDEQESFIAPDDPPDMFDRDQIDNDPSVDEPDSCHESEESESFRESDESETYHESEESETYYESDESESDQESDESSSESDFDRPILYNDGNPSSNSSFDEDRRYSFEIILSRKSLGGSRSENSVKFGRSIRGQVTASNCERSHSKFSSDLAFEYDQEINPPQRSSSSKRFKRVQDFENIGYSDSVEDSEECSDEDSEEDSVDDSEEDSVEDSEEDCVEDSEEDSVTTTSQQKPVSWLARQISNRKLIEGTSSSRSIEPKGLNITSHCDGVSPRDSGFHYDSDIDEYMLTSKTSSDYGNVLSAAETRRKVTSEDEETFEENSNLEPLTEYFAKSKIRKNGTSSLGKIQTLGFDDRTLTTDTMSQEIPSVIISKIAASDNSFKDSESVLSSSTSETRTKSSRKKSKKKLSKVETGTHEGRKKKMPSKKSSNKKKERPSTSGSTKKALKKEKSKKKKDRKKSDDKKKIRSEDTSPKAKTTDIELCTKKKKSKPKKKKKKGSKKEVRKSKSHKKKSVSKANSDKDSKTKKKDKFRSSSSRKPKDLDEPGRINATKEGKSNRISLKTSSKREQRLLQKATARNYDDKLSFDDNSVFSLLDKLRACENDC